MPFGSDPFRDIAFEVSTLATIARGHQCLSAVIPFGTGQGQGEASEASEGSPMPFGSDPFRDQKNRKCVQSEYRNRHQCLSAVIPFGTTQRY